MDLRTEKTEKAIRNAFIELRTKKPLEKITVKELCALACINKSTFYSHYADIYDLSDSIEEDLVVSIIKSIDHLKDYTVERSDEFTRELSLAFMSQLSMIKIVFSGKEQNCFGNRLDRELKKIIFRKYPEFEYNMQNNLLLSFCIQGAYHARMNNPEADPEMFVNTIGEIVRCLQPLVKREFVNG